MSESLKSTSVYTLPSATIQKSLDSSGSGPHDPGMEARMVALETRMDGLEHRMDRLDVHMDRVETRLTSLELKVSEVSGKLDVLVSHVVGKLPSWWQMPVVIGSTVVMLGGLVAAAQKLHLLAL
jgi:hypothetical protein